MTTMELDAHRMNLTPYTMEELNARFDEAEAEIDAGIPSTLHEDLMKKMHNMIAKL